MAVHKYDVNGPKIHVCGRGFGKFKDGKRVCCSLRWKAVNCRGCRKKRGAKR